MLSSGAPWPFDITGGGMAALVMLVLIGGAPALAAMSRPQDFQIRNLTRMSCALAGVAVSIYVVHFLAWGFRGYLPLIIFLPNIPAWSWTVLLTVLVWGAILGWSLTTLANAWNKPPGDRNAIPYIKGGLTLAIFGGLWLCGAFVPVPLNYRDFPLAWQAGTTINFFLHCGYIGATVEALASMLLPLLPTQGLAEQQMTVRVSDRNQTMYVAKERDQ
jgi:hypothetical protein